jgi:hypothetical protein
MQLKRGWHSQEEGKDNETALPGRWYGLHKGTDKKMIWKRWHRQENDMTRGMP